MVLESAELTSAAGYISSFDPLLLGTMRQLQSASSDDEYRIACLMFVFAAISLPRLARLPDSVYRHDFDGHFNNIHCIPIAICSLQAAYFLLCGRQDHEDRAKEFLALASSSLLRMDQELSNAAAGGGGSGAASGGGGGGGSDGLSIAQRNRDSVYILLDLYVQREASLTMDLLESCFPYALIRNAYHNVRKAAYKSMAGHQRN